MQDEEKINKPKKFEKIEKLDKKYNTGEPFRNSKENSTFYGDDNIKNINHKSYKTTYNFNTSMNKKSQDMFSLKTLSNNLNSVRYLGMSEYHSTNTLQNSSYVWSFSKSNRFAGGFYKKPITESFYDISRSMGARSTSMGYGRKYELKALQGRNSPPPDTYTIRSQFETNKDKKKGVTIHEKVPLVPDTRLSYPGPGTYYNGNIIRLTKGAPITIKSRTMFFYDEDVAKSKHCISPQTYLPSTKIEENLRYTKIGFGIGQRASTSGVENPGPGTYDLPSVFDKNRKYRVPLN